MTLGRQCQRWGALPRSGGILEQDDLELAAMSLALEAAALPAMAMSDKRFNHALYEQIMDLIE